MPNQRHVHRAVSRHAMARNNTFMHCVTCLVRNTLFDWIPILALFTLLMAVADDPVLAPLAVGIILITAYGAPLPPRWDSRVRIPLWESRGRV